MKQIVIDKNGLILLALLAGICVYLQPLTSDDFLYSFIHLSTERIETLSDAFISANSYYMNWNGRYFPNLFDHISLCLLPHWVMAVIGFLIVGSTLLLIVKLGGKKISIAYVFLIFWLLNFDKSDTIYWNTGFFNYAFPGACCLAVVYLYLMNKKYSSVLLFFFSLFAALQHEGISLPLSGAFLFTLLSKKSRAELSKSQVSILIGFGLGTLFCVFAPGTFVRMNSAAAAAPKNLSFYLWAVWESVFSLFSTWLLIAILFFRRKKIDIDFYHRNEVIILTIIFSILLFIALSIFSEVPAQRYFYFIHIFSMVLLCSQMAEFKWTESVPISRCLYIVCILVLGYCLVNQFETRKIVNKELSLIQNTSDYVVPVDRTYLTSDPNGWINKTLCEYYNKEKLIGYPSALYYEVYLNDCRDVKNNINGWMELGNQYVLPWNEKIPVIQWTKVFDFPIIRFKRFTSKPTVEIFASKAGKKYLLLTNEKIGTKVIDIRLRIEDK